MNYCGVCGSSDIRLRTPAGDNRERHVCGACGAIFYQNPKVVAGCILHDRGRILLCKRAIEPRRGYWTVPAGFMENGESLIEAAAREAREEACAQSADLRLHSIYNLKHINQVYVLYAGTLRDGHARAGAETAEVALARADEIPWSDLAFPVVAEALRLYCDAGSDARRAAPHQGDIFRDADGRLQTAYYGRG